MTIYGYLNNPYGKSDKYPSNEAHKNALLEEYHKVQSHMKVSIYKVGYSIVYHVFVPSTADPRLKYDVIIELVNYLDDPAHSSIGSYDARFFSNSPSFVYTYANLFFVNDMMCDWLFKKYSKQVQTERPLIRNPNVVVQFEKSLYLAMYHIYNSGLLVPNTVKTLLRTATKSSIVSAIQSQEMVETAYKRYTALQKESERIKPKLKTQSVNTNAFSKGSTATRVTATTHKTNSVKRTKTTKKV